jgi:uncharacterized membrane protein
MENNSQQQSTQSARPQFPFDPNKSLTYERQHHAHDDFVWHGGQAPAPRTAAAGTALGWLSVALGAAQLLAPRAFARAAGLPPWLLLYRAIGLREIACGVGLLSRPNSVGLRWARVAGDTMDGALLGAALFAPASQRQRLLRTAVMAVGISAMDVRAAAPQRRSPRSAAVPGSSGKRRVLQAITVNSTPEACYAFWRDMERFPSFMRHVESVHSIDGRRSHWVATGPAGSHVEWDAEITQDQPNRLLAWRSTAEADVHNSGEVRFEPAPGGNGTVIEVAMEYRPPGGRAGAALAMLFGEEPSQQIEGDLRRFKQLIETGEIPTTRGQPHGPRTMKARFINRRVEQ